MRIFIAEDDDISRKTLRVMLQKQGYEVLEASDGEKAWRILREPDPPPLLVLDIMMPNMDGLEVMDSMREDSRLNDIPIIFLTARGDEKTEIEGLNKGGDDYITKPISTSKLVSRIKAVLRRYDQHEEAAPPSTILEVHDLKIDKERYTDLIEQELRHEPDHEELNVRGIDRKLVNEFITEMIENGRNNSS